MSGDSPLRICYFGLPLGALLLARDGHRIELCVLSPVAAPGLRRVRRELGARVLQASELGSELDSRVNSALETTQSELLVSWFWTRRLPLAWLTRPERGAIGVHPSLLPRHRGPNPYFWAIDAGDSETGVTVHRLEAEYDTGHILDSESIPVGTRNAWELARALDRPSLRALRRTVRRFAEGKSPQEMPQRPELVSQAPEPSGELLRVDFGWTSERVLRRIRALSPVPGLALTLAGLPFFVTRAEPASGFVATLEPGEAQILGGRLLLRTGDGAIAVSRATREDELGDAVDMNGADLAHLLTERLGSRAAKSFKGEPG
ncbi:MAG TPA: formyltransferase family protein [Polyangiaceae bacterium]|jgi:methionyl-tRNA formyltransferase|nr:formyltransferase family protein [Polyangiaceae bacterium]